MQELEQKTVSLANPEVSVLWLQANAWWLVLAALIAFLWWCWLDKEAWRKVEGRSDRERF